MKRHGKPVWLKHTCTKTFTHKTHQGKTIKCKGGTQIIDRFWQHLRRFMKYRSYDVGSLAMNTRIRSVQWAYWHRDEDLWLQTGAMLKRLCKQWLASHLCQPHVSADLRVSQCSVWHYIYLLWQLCQPYISADNVVGRYMKVLTIMAHSSLNCNTCASMT